MLMCDDLYGASESEFLAATSQGEPHEFELSPQRVCTLYCDHCAGWHSYEVSASEVWDPTAPELELRRSLWRSIQCERRVILSVSEPNLNARVILSRDGAHLYLDSPHHMVDAQLMNALYAFLAAHHFARLVLHVPEEGAQMDLDLAA
jgi:hypothetical protein